VSHASVAVSQLPLHGSLIRRPPTSTLFPTRRSSDLCQCTTSPPLPERAVRQRAQLEWQRFQKQPDSQNKRRNCRDVSAQVCRHRSEEHTSELQSREKLVCRLLLEKKKEHVHNQHVSW